MKKTRRQNIDTIAEKTPAVAQAMTEHASTIDIERKTEAEVLVWVISTITPALPALVGKIETEKTWLTKTGEESVRFHDESGVLILDEFNRTNQSGVDQGNFGGSGIYLTESGKLLVANRDGYWSERAGERNERRTTLVPISVEDAVVDYSLNDIVATVADLLVRQDAGRARAIAGARARIAKLRAALESV